MIVWTTDGVYEEVRKTPDGRFSVLQRPGENWRVGVGVPLDPNAISHIQVDGRWERLWSVVGDVALCGNNRRVNVYTIAAVKLPDHAARRLARRACAAYTRDMFIAIKIYRHVMQHGVPPDNVNQLQEEHDQCIKRFLMS